MSIDQQQDVFNVGHLEQMMDTDKWLREHNSLYAPVTRILVSRPGIKARGLRLLGGVVRSTFVGIQPLWVMGCKISEMGQMPFKEWITKHGQDYWRGV